MAALTQTLLIITCIYLADCRVRGKFQRDLKSSRPQIQENTNIDNVHQIKTMKHESNGHLVVGHANTEHDADAIVFRNDNDIKVYPADKIVDKIENASDVMIHKKGLSNSDGDRKTVPILPKVIPAIEAKEVFTNVIKDKDNAMNKSDIELESKSIKDKTAAMVIDTIIQKNETVTENMEVNKNDSNSNDTMPDFSSRFGVTGNYMLVPVNNVQSYQPVASGIPIQNMQNIPQTYVANNDQVNRNPLVDANLQYATPTLATNIVPNTQYIAPNANSQIYTTPNVPNYNMATAQDNNYVPINVPNTYVINGQLYAAVTVPNNANVPNNLYFVNPQSSGYQVANNVPLYQLVSVGNQEQPNVNAQYGIHSI